VGSAKGGGEPTHASSQLCGSGNGLRKRFRAQAEDPDAIDEHRFVTLGLSDQATLLVVVYAYVEPDIIRVISAWKANKRQGDRYEEGRR
jgi:uncharacterized DUF497 family protein